MKFNESYKFLSFVDAYVEGTDMYLSNCIFNSLFKIDLVNYESQYLGRASRDNIWKENLHQKIIKHKDSLYLFSNGMNVSEYNINTKTLIDYSYNEISILDSQKSEAGGYIIRDALVWIIPGVISEPLMTFDLDTKMFIDNKWWDSNIFKKIPENMLGNNLKISDFYDNEVWGIIEKTSYLFCINLLLESVDVFNLGNIYELNSIFRNGKDLYLSVNNEIRVIKWNCKNGIEKVFELKDDIMVNNSGIHLMIGLSNKILIVPREEPVLYQVKNGDKSIELFTKSMDIYCKLTDHRNTWPNFSGYKIINNILYLFPYGVDKMILINLDTDEIITKNILLPNEMEKYYITEVLWKEMMYLSKWEGYITEELNNLYPLDNRNSLSYFIKYISSNDKSNNLIEFEPCGGKIWNEIKNSTLKKK